MRRRSRWVGRGCYCRVFIADPEGFQPRSESLLNGLRISLGWFVLISEAFMGPPGSSIT
jgi:hypothetical protein